MASPKISVLLPVYNAEKYVAAAVQSILNQTFTDFELIVIDDGSTDGSKTILENLAANDARVRLIRQENKGLLKTLNEGIGLCRAELLARMDADDISLPQRFARQVEFLRAHPETVVLGTRVLMMDPDEVPIFETFALTTHEQIDAANRSGFCAIAHPSVMMRKCAIQAVGGYRGQANEDLDLWLRIGENGRFANLPEVLLHYRMHTSQKSHFEAGASATRVQLMWSRSALAAGNYRNAMTLARKALMTRLTMAGAITYGLALLGPVGAPFCEQGIGSDTPLVRVDYPVGKIAMAPGADGYVGRPLLQYKDNGLRMIGQLVYTLGRVPGIGSLLRKIANAHADGSVAKIRTGVCAGMLWKRYRDYGNAPWLGIHEPDVQAVLAREIKPGQVVYDVGANGGFFTLMASRLVGPSGKVFAFEPLPFNGDTIDAHVEMNQLNLVQVVRAAVGEKSGEAQFTTFSGARTARFAKNFPGIGTKFNVKVVSLDDFVRDHPAPDFLKVDVECAETDLIRGARQLMSERHPTFLIELHTPELAAEVETLMTSAGYKLFDLHGNAVSQLNAAQHVLARPVQVPAPIVR